MQIWDIPITEKLFVNASDIHVFCVSSGSPTFWMLSGFKCWGSGNLEGLILG